MCAFEVARPCPLTTVNSRGLTVCHCCSRYDRGTLPNGQSGNAAQFHPETAACACPSSFLGLRLIPSLTPLLSSLTLYLQCASALRWAGMGEVIWATSIETIIRGGRNQIYLPSSLIVSASYSLPHQTHWFGSVLANETDPGFLHQFDEAVECPEGCYRGTVEGSRVSTCLPTEEWVAEWKGREGEWERQLMETRGRIAEDWYGVKANGGGIRSHDEL